ncbi:MAG: V-type ATP synthase subunit E [Bacillota bacterium]
MKEGAERIVRRIMDDAEAQAESIKKEAAEKAEAVKADARKKAERREENILEQARKEAEEQKRRIVGVAQLEARKELLAAKQDLISEAFDGTLEQLVNLDDREYLSIIKKMLLNLVETGKEQVLCSAADLKRIPDSFWQEVNQELAGQGKKGELTLSLEPREIKGGFVLKADDMEINCSFEALLAMKRDELEPEVAAVLFK